MVLKKDPNAVFGKSSFNDKNNTKTVPGPGEYVIPPKAVEGK